MLSHRYDAALALAADLHRLQRRKGSDVPYLSHLLSVSALVIEIGGDEDQAIAALLHDAVEDQGGAATLALIGERFGPVVAAIVSDCTDADVIPKPPWRPRKEAYLAHLETAPAPSLLVSLADKTHNARAVITDGALVGRAVFDRFKSGRDGALWYYGRCADVFVKRVPDGAPRILADELTRLVERMHAI